MTHRYSLFICLLFTAALLIFSLPAAGLAQTPAVLPDDIDISVSPDGIVPMPDNVPEVFKYFDRYTKVHTPSGKPIHLVIEKGYTDRQAVYARKILVNHLTEVPGSKYGQRKDKTLVANAIANNNGVIFLFLDTNTFRSYRPKLRDAGVRGQDLREYETILEGVTEYLDQEDPTRDASYEEIMHFVQGYGTEHAHPAFTNALNDAHDRARGSGLYNRNTTFEYWICGFEAYFDLWKHDPGGDGTRGGEYIPISNFKLKAIDPAMYDLVEGYLGTHWLYTAEVVDEYDGTFSMTLDEDLTYTNKSQYLRKAMLTGGNNANLTGNNEDNNLFGNSGNNIITPLGGNDVIDGGLGNDTVVFGSDARNYIVRKQDGRVIVEGINFQRDGFNILINVEEIRFNDKLVNTGRL